jgi:hypothetical protein
MSKRSSTLYPRPSRRQRLAADTPQPGQLKPTARCVCRRPDITILDNGTRANHTRRTRNRFGKLTRVHCPGSGTRAKA